MKQITIALTTLITISCQQPGTTSMLLNDHTNLPNELKGLKIYEVSVGNGRYVKVAVLNNTLNSLSYIDGKVDKSVMLVNKESNKVVSVSAVLMENDSLIICKK